MSITVQDNFLSSEDFLELKKYTEDNEFFLVSTGEKSFLVLYTPDWVEKKLHIPMHEMVLTFIRKAHRDFDTLPRIHADNIINGKRVSMARVMYIDLPTSHSTGTAFWNHHVHGEYLPEDVTEEEFNRLIVEDANDLHRWEYLSEVEGIPNRLLTYPGNKFHSKTPPIVEQDRVVLVAFYCPLF